MSLIKTKTSTERNFTTNGDEVIVNKTVKILFGIKIGTEEKTTITYYSKGIKIKVKSFYKFIFLYML